ncbi:MAG: hypothetical protein BYD32DRAFT_429493 [Podila humilis]|nr:MAG: hypothetical protein BYD32DRAFT_429493 [Podila humilis]
MATLLSIVHLFPRISCHVCVSVSHSLKKFNATSFDMQRMANMRKKRYKRVCCLHSSTFFFILLFDLPRNWKKKKEKDGNGIKICHLTNPWQSRTVSRIYFFIYVE